jgi:hypothetical protein
MRQNHQLLALELARLTHKFTKHLVAHRLRRFDEPPPLAGWTRLAQQVFQTFTCALARHFDQPQGRNRRDAGLHVIVGQRLLQGLDDLAAMLRLLHIDEIDDDDTAQIAQAQLPRDGHRRLEIGAENGLLQIPMADERAGVDVDGRHRFGLVDDQIAAGFQRHFAIQRLLDFFLDVVQFEHRARIAVQFDARQCLLHEGAGELAHLAMRIRLVDQHLVDIRPQQIAQHAQMQRQIGVHQVAGLGAQALLTNEVPKLAQVHHIGAHGLRRRIFRGGAHDESRVLSGEHTGLHRGAQALALAFILDPGRDAHSMAFRHVHQVTRRQRDVRGEPRTLGPQRILHDLDQDLVAFRDQRANVVGARRLDTGVRMTRIEDVRGVQERRAFHADFDECRLHARKNPRHATFVDIADQSTAAGALEKHFLQHAVLDDCSARFVSAGIDQNFSAHRAWPGRCQCDTPASAKSSAVSNSGRPITPE